VMSDPAYHLTVTKSDLHDKVVALGEQNLSNFIFGYLPDHRDADGMRIRYKVWIALNAFSRSAPGCNNFGPPGFTFTRGEWDGALAAYHAWVFQRYGATEAELLGKRMDAVTESLFEVIELNGCQESAKKSEAIFENERRCLTEEHWSRL
jgi:hypothetical protein